MKENLWCRLASDGCVTAQAVFEGRRDKIAAIETIAQNGLIVVGILTHTPRDAFGTLGFARLIFFPEKICCRGFVNFVTNFSRKFGGGSCSVWLVLKRFAA